jgi:hypothetical protein
MRWGRLTIAVALALGGRGALAFHEGGVAACEGCHSMHGDPDASKSGPNLLVASDPSSTCLQCHATTGPGTYQVYTSNVMSGIVPQQYTPGGDFAWLQRTFLWPNAKGTTETSPGERHGHSIVAQDYGLAADSVNLTSPGGSYPSDRLTCISCHDPHGRYRQLSDGSITSSGTPTFASGSYGGMDLKTPFPGFSVGTYRLLGGVGYLPKSAGAVQPFFSPPPVALAPWSYNRSERVTETRVAYGTGMSEWCQNCHANIHATSDPSQTFKHPVGASARLATGGEFSIYNNYIRTGVLTGAQATSYTSLVPYEEGLANRTVLAQHAVSDGTQTSGPTTGGENVMCLSCHRAHATGWDHALRWNMPQSGTITFGSSWPGVDAIGDARLPANAQGRLQAETRAAMYDRDPSIYSAYQKTLCNKCHAQD